MQTQPSKRATLENTYLPTAEKNIATTLTSSSHTNCAIIYPGTFDPITSGHIDIIARATKLFSRVIVAIALSNKKRTLFSVDERQALASIALRSLPNVTVWTFSGLLVDFAREKNIFLILRGLRAISDFEHEFQLIGLYQQLEPRIETIFLMPATKYLYISSSMVREIAELHGDISQLVPIEIAKALREKFK